MTKLAASSGTVIYQNENKLYLIRKPAQWTGGLLFATGLAAFLFLANALLHILVFKTQFHNTQNVTNILLAIGILFAFVSWRIIAYRKKLNAVPVTQLKCICIIDLAANNLLDGQQNLMAPLKDVQLQRKMQLTSSSPALLLAWSNNALTIVEGNPFSGGIAAVEKVLISKGIKTR